VIQISFSSVLRPYTGLVGRHGMTMLVESEPIQ